MTPTTARNLLKACLLVGLVLFVLPTYSATSKQAAPLTDKQKKSMMKHAASLVKSRNADKAAALINKLLDQTTDVKTCLDLAASTEPVGFPMQETRRKCMTKALSLCKSNDDYLKVAAKCKDYQLYELTKESMDRMIQQADSQAALYELAALAQKHTMHDVAHMAMSKAYDNVKDPQSVLDFAFHCKDLGLEDLERKSIRNSIDEGKSAHELCALLNQIEPLHMNDLNRYCIRRALDMGVTVDDFAEVFEEARRYGQSDIMEVARYRGRKQQVINRIQENQTQSKPSENDGANSGGF